MQTRKQNMLHLCHGWDCHGSYEGDTRPDPSDSGRARGLGIGRQGATDIVRHREAGSHRKPTDFYENRPHS